MVPTFYDSIEVSRDRAIAKFHRREERMNPAFAFLLTLFEAFFTLLLLRFFYRLVMRGWRRVPGKPAVLAAGDVATVPGSDD